MKFINRNEILISIATICLIIVLVIISNVTEYQQNNFNSDNSNSNSQTELSKIKDSLGNIELIGDGTREKPYLINSCEDFQIMSDYIKSGDSQKGVYYRLTKDIDMENNPYLYPLGNGKEFAGILDGNGYGLINTEMDNITDMALFGKLSGTVVNLSLKNGIIDGSKKTGGFAVEITKTGKLLNCVNYITVYGKLSGGLAYSSKGTIINCGYFGNNDEGTAKSVLNNIDSDIKHGARIENTYTSKSGLMELTNFGSDEMKKFNHDISTESLNKRLLSLANEYADCEFSIWEDIGEWPGLTNRKIHKVNQIVYSNGDEEYLAEYDVNNGKWVFREVEIIEPGTIAIATENDLMNINVEENAHEIICNYEESEICINTDYIQKEQLVQKNILYYDRETFSEKEKIYSIISSGDYRFSGEESGQIVIDLKKDDKKGINIKFDNFTLISNYGPAILNKSKQKLSIHLNDNTVNTLKGTKYINTHEMKQKYGGAISSNGDIELYGESGCLTINGMWEGIEGDKSLKVCGGNYIMSSLDDAISLKGKFEIKAGKMLIAGGDDVLDTKKVFINGGEIVGDAPHERMLNTEETIFNKGLFAGSSIEIGKISNGQGIIVEISFEQIIEKDVYFLLVDEQENPVMAYRMKKETGVLTYGDDTLKEGNYRAYLCSDIKGEWTGNLCKNVKNYEIISQFITDRGEIMVIKKGFNKFAEKQ